jgi:outer membrane lipoprotein LolB
MQRRISLMAALISATFFIAGCAIPARAPGTNGSDSTIWRGRMSVRVDSDHVTPQPQSFSAAFELTGSTETGELTLYTPLGSTAASLSWSPQMATLRTNDEVRQFESLGALVKQAIGTDLPVSALFAWLAGDDVAVAGWRADLSQHASGRIIARRTQPTPLAELRLVLDK